ncbi:MAG: hypothetical protein IT260_01155 [Saprospiraceae bacterium]|nr:hypothetical protein [Saprospiraceae bacterium]
MRILVFSIFLIITVLSVLLPSCRHEIILPYNPDPTDTVPPPPVDTSDLTGVPCSPDTVYFQNQILPLIISQCAKSGCHDVQSHEEGVVLVDYLRIISTGEVKAFKPNSSELYKVLNDTDPKDRMPPAPDAPLTTEQKNLIKKWIEQGALNNACNESYGSCNTTGVTYTNFVSGLMANQCVGCHGGANPQGGLKLTNYAEVKASGQSGKLYGSIAHQAGYSAMPQGGTALSTCFTNKIKAWVDAGMPQ